MRPMHIAANSPHAAPVPTLERLVKHGAAIDSTGFQDSTPLFQAAFHGQLAAVKWLVEHKADINAKSSAGQTVLGIAKFCKKKAVIEYLETLGAK